MPDYREGVKKEVAEIKFLIHDLRVERFINEVIHFHATLDTDLEIYSVDQAQVLHGEDLQVLKKQAVGLRRASGLHERREEPPGDHPADGRSTSTPSTRSAS
jgi:hypothetical protein